MSLIFIAFFLGISCSSDSDFMPDYSVEEPPTIFVQNTVTTLKNNSIVITPLGKNGSDNLENLIITSVSTPSIGSTVINEDNTITYTPNNNKIGNDGFEYTARIINFDTITSKEIGSITIKIAELEEVYPKGDNIYYVTTHGKTTNSGATENNAWSLQHAFKTAKAGDVVYIKAGNYGNLNLEVLNAGNEANPIKFIGYKENPGDILATNGSTFKHNQSIYSATDYPTIEGIRANGNVSGTALRIARRYVEIHNFQIKDKHIGIISYQGYNTFNNIIILDMGNYSGRHGRGILLSGEYNKFTNSFIKNGTELLSTSGSHQLIENNWIGSDQNVNDAYSTGYYLLLFGSDANGSSANYNMVRNNTIYREAGQYHQGHGLTLKGSAKYNKLIDNTVINSPLEFSMDGVEYNTVSGGTVRGTGATGDGSNQKYAFILIANGAHHNTFQDMTVTGDTGVRFSDWNDGTNSPNDAVDAGNNNLFKNIDFNNLLSGIEFSWHWNGSGAAANNVFENCSFTNITQELFRTERPNSGTIMRNCTFANNPTTVYNQDNENRQRVEPKNQKKPLKVTFIGSTFRNNGFATPQ